MIYISAFIEYDGYIFSWICPFIIFFSLFIEIQHLFLLSVKVLFLCQSSRFSSNTHSIKEFRFKNHFSVVLPYFHTLRRTQIRNLQVYLPLCESPASFIFERPSLCLNAEAYVFCLGIISFLVRLQFSTRSSSRVKNGPSFTFTFTLVFPQTLPANVCSPSSLLLVNNYLLFLSFLLD